MTSFKTFVAAAALISTTVAGVAIAGGHGGTNPAVKARQSHMQLYQHNLVVLGQMARGNVEYNADAANAAASNIVALTQLNQMSYWPPGTDSDTLTESNALPVLWESFPEVIEKATAVAEAAQALQAAAGNGVAEMGPALGALGQACTACHESFQKPRG